MASLVEDSLIKTSLIEQVVAPITIHICYLTLLSEADDTTEQFIQLEASARAVAKASRNMADVASRVMAESEDDVMRLEMGLLLEPLIMSGQHVLLATQKLSIQPEVRQHRDELIQATQNVLLGVVKVLLVADEATVRKITSAAHWLLDSLRYAARLCESICGNIEKKYLNASHCHVHNNQTPNHMDITNSLQREIRSCVTANCKLILQLWTEIQQMRQININCTDKQKPNEHQEKLRISLMIQIHELDEAVVKATLYQIIDTFVLESSPLEQLVNTVHNVFEADLEDGLDMDPIQTLFKTFISHADRMAKVASFVSALATDEKSLEGVENSISCLMRLKDGVLPLLLELEGDSVLYHGALHKLISFHQKWEEETKQLLNAFYNVINVKDFIHLSILEMKDDLDRCQEAHKSQNHHLLSKHLRLLIGRMSQIVQFVRRCVDKSDDPIYRNGLLVLIKQAEKSLAEVTGHATEIFNTNFQEEAFPLLTNSIMVSIKNFDVLLEGLDGLQHPDLLSPLREGARQVTTTPPVPYTEEPKRTTNDQAKIETLDNRDKKEDLEVELKATLPEKKNTELTTVHQPETRNNSVRVPVFSSLDPSLAYTSLFLKQEAERWDVPGNQIVKVTREMADKIYDMTQYLKRKGPIQSKDAFVSSAKDLVLSCQTVTHFVKVIAEHCLDQQSNKELCIIAERIVTITNQLTIISSVQIEECFNFNCQNGDFPATDFNCDGLLFLDELAWGLRQPEPNSDAAKAASLCIQWKKNLLIHRTQEQLNPETDDLGLRKTSQQHATPSLAPPISVLERYK
ncbi:catenin alpha-1 [Tachysurus fulvidraco]|uniref:catenin alpha-1 n=1 Tax=Tachysurus fulvidraco TaxID=1234273 RepID=UPI001FF01B34|nr:catenin alpha-1 [Tachysurus fulvidraco]